MVMVFRLLQCVFLSASVACIPLGYAQTKGEVNFKVGKGTNNQDSNIYDSIFFSLEEAAKFPSRVSELSLEDKGLKRFPHEILSYKNLRVLNISDNQIDSIPVNLFQQCRKLNVLQYANNGLKSIPQVLLNPSLKVLDLSENDLTSIPDDIALCRRLEELDLHSNLLTTYPSSSVLLKSLTTLILSGNPLTTIHPWIINQPRLKILFIDNTLIEHSYEMLCKSQTLRFLNLEECKISELPACFCEMKNLKVLLVSGTPLPAAQWETLHQCLPHLQIR